MGRSAINHTRLLNAVTTGQATLPTLGRGTHGVAYVTWSANVTAGRVVLESAPRSDYTGTWHQLADFTFQGDDRCDEAQFAGVYGAIRLRVATTIVDGTITGEAILHD